jgi:hypothetical protein
MMTFGQKLSFCRKEKKLSQAELGNSRALTATLSASMSG